MSDPQRSPTPVAVEYPSADGQSMAETPVHRDCIIDTIGGLREHFAGRPDIYVSGDMFVYDEEGNPRASVVPDVFVVVGAVKDEWREGGWRDTYKLWEEPKGPDFVLEVTSRSTRRDDQVRKRALYGRLGVGSYFLYDPRGVSGAAAARDAFARERVVPLSPVGLPGGGGQGLWSEALGLSVSVPPWASVASVRSGRRSGVPHTPGGGGPSERSRGSSSRRGAYRRTGSAPVCGRRSGAAGEATALRGSVRQRFAVRRVHQRSGPPGRPFLSGFRRPRPAGSIPRCSADTGRAGRQP